MRNFVAVINNFHTAVLSEWCGWRFIAQPTSGRMPSAPYTSSDMERAEGAMLSTSPISDMERAEGAMPSVSPLRLCPKSQAKIVGHSTELNPQPTAVPAPQKQFFGTLGMRHVICIVGLPHRGRNYVASELGWYLEFFHGAEVRLFDVAESASGKGSRESHAEDLLQAIEEYLRSSTVAASALNFEQDSVGLHTKTQMADQGKVAIVLPFRMVHENDMKRDRRLLERSQNAWQHLWSCSNPKDREWVRAHLAARTACKLMFIELDVSDARLRRQQLEQLLPENRATFLDIEAVHRREYVPLGRSASGEARLSYLRLHK